jgi:hypothetical protein
MLQPGRDVAEAGSDEDYQACSSSRWREKTAVLTNPEGVEGISKDLSFYES